MFFNFHCPWNAEFDFTKETAYLFHNVLTQKQACLITRTSYLKIKSTYHDQKDRGINQLKIQI